MNLDEARDALAAQAKLFAIGLPADEPMRALCLAAQVYVAEWQKAKPKAQTRESTSLKIPFGRSKGVALNEAKVDDLKWVSGILSENIGDPTKARYRDSNEKLLAAVDRELATR